MFKKSLLIICLIILSSVCIAQAASKRTKKTEVKNPPLAEWIYTKNKLAEQENLKLPQVSDQMVIEMKRALGSKYQPYAKTNISQIINVATVDGTYEEEDENGSLTTLKFEVVRDLSKTVAMADVYYYLAEEKKDIPNFYTKTKNLYGIETNFREYSKFEFQEMNFYGEVNDMQNHIYMSGNLGPYINIQIQSSGPEFKRLADEFLKSIDYKALRKAVKDDNKTMASVNSKLYQKTKDIELINQIMSDYPPATE